MSDEFSGVLTAKTKVIFTINRIKDYYDKTFRIVSEKFTIGSIVWNVVLLARYRKLGVLNTFIPAIVLSSQSNQIDTKSSVFIIDSNSKKFFVEHQTDPGNQSYQEVREKIFKSAEEDWFPSNGLTIGVYITVYSEALNFIEKGLDYRKTFNNKEINDLKIICGQKEFFVSKLLLISRSEVFERMFANNMREQQKNELIVEDISEEVMEQFLRYLYFGDSDKLDEFKYELIYSANKYGIEDLKTICENLMFIEINTKNAIKTLYTFIGYNCNQMKDETIDFIARNLTAIRSESMDEWLALITEDSQLTDQITESMSKLLDNGITSMKDVDNYLKTYSYHYIS